MKPYQTDWIQENYTQLCQEYLPTLLADRTTKGQICWASDDYAVYGADYAPNKPITPELITSHAQLIQPRTAKSQREQLNRTRNKAEVFTPAWVCNAQNNLIDNAWFGVERNRFNRETLNGWVTNYYPVSFHPKSSIGRTWQEYVKAPRLEITCGEAPYLTSRYDAVTGAPIPVKQRIGLLDRKLRIVSENTKDEEGWLLWAELAIKSIYGYDWQGDNVLLSRLNLFVATAEAYVQHFQKQPSLSWLGTIAEIISWNIWQMDALKGVVPNSCHEVLENTFFSDEIITIPCPGCKYNNIREHNGIYCKLMDWDKAEPIRYIDLLGGGKRGI